MSVYRKSYNDRKGRRQLCRLWTIKLVDHTGRIREFSSGVASRKLAQRINDRTIEIIEHRRIGAPITPALLEWAACQTNDIRARLNEWGVIAFAGGMIAHSLNTLLEGWESHFRTKGVVDTHRTHSVGRVKAIVGAVAVQYFEDLQPDPVIQAIRNLGVSAATQKAYWIAFKAFARWSTDRIGLLSSPLLKAKPKFIAITDEGKRRRAATHAEVQAVLEAARSGPSMYGISGLGWSLIYRLAVATGFRRNEIATICPVRCELDREPHRITVPAAYAKSRKTRTIEVDSQLAADLRDYIAAQGIEPRQPVFNLPEKTAHIFRVHLEAAGIPDYDNASGTSLDFHALRTTFLTTVARATDIETARRLAGHSSVTTTQAYLDTTTDRQRAGLEAARQLARSSVAGSVAALHP